MNMNFNQIAMLQKIKGCMDRFRANHPKFPLFINAVSQEAMKEGTVIEITVTTPEGKNYCSNIKLQANDMELIDCLRSLKTTNN
ncbi:hypothetical protein ACQRBN_00585 [Bariatricus sp. SGI.154]|uniref:hypothetical protein n=1 Tax=Bariatricus sp. SGI.154 TaxID=3420549 RepID=UPI003CFD2C43